MMGENVDQRAFELLRVGMAELGFGQFLHVVVQEPGVIERRLQDQRFAPRDRGAMAAMQRAGRELRARRHISCRGRFRRRGRGGEVRELAAPAGRAALRRANCGGRARDFGRREQRRKPLGEILPVVAAHGFVADRLP